MLPLAGALDSATGETSARVGGEPPMSSATRARLAAATRSSPGLRSASPMMLETSFISGSSIPSVAGPGVPTRIPEGSSGGCGSNGIPFLLIAMPISSQNGLGLLAADPERPQVAQRQVRVRPARDDPDALRRPDPARALETCGRPERRTRRRRIHRFLQADGLRGDHVLERPALHHREDRLVDRLGVLLAGQDDRAPRAAQGLVRREGHDVGERHRARVRAARAQADEVRRVDPQDRADLVGDAPNAAQSISLG